jgi:peptidoglycan LD-endopeptidase LytH
MKNAIRIIISILVVIGIVAAYFYFRRQPHAGRNQLVDQWIKDPGAHPDWRIQPGDRCGSAPFVAPTSGFIGYLWGDSFYFGHHHQGLDIFGGSEPGKTPVAAAYDGYLTRLPDWKATVIIRIPSDPLQPGRQIWTYYTHMADENGASYVSPDFPPGTHEVFVKAGTQLGHQGNFSGTPGNPVGVHLHISIVKDDGSGHFMNELKIENTLDPSPYFQRSLNAYENNAQIPVCLAP